MQGHEEQSVSLADLPVAAFTCDTQGLLTGFNALAAELWGREPKLNDPTDRFGGSLKLFAADGSPLPVEKYPIASAISEQKEIPPRHLLIERPNATRLPLLVHAKPLRDSSGKLLGAIAVLFDVTDRNVASQAESQLAAIIKSSDDAIYSRDLAGRITSWNAGAERLYGYETAEIVGRFIELITPPDILEAERDLVERICFFERIEHFETVRLNKQGRRIDVSLTMSPIHGPTGEIIGISKIARDITAQKQADKAFRAVKDALAQQYDQLRQSDRRKDEFLATLAHELRNPLAPVSNALHILRLSNDLSPAVQRMRQIMERQVNHLVRLVDDLMEISRITRGKIELRKEFADLAGIIDSAVDTSRPAIDASHHQLAIAITPEVIKLEVDPMRLAQVISNLISNAAKYTDPGGQIWLTAQRTEGEVVITVSDSGMGIPKEMLPRVFDMFAQVDRTLKRAQGGLGIGLALAKNLVEMHGGAIEARSDGLDRGSQFIVRLPIASATPIASTALPAPLRFAYLPKRRILVVDDTHAAAYILARLLEALGQEVFVAQSAAEALQAATAQHPHMVISDIAMPNMDGYELAHRLRQLPGLESTVVVALTGYSQARDRQRARESGFDHYLVKPVSLDALQQLLASLPIPEATPNNALSPGNS